MTSTHPYAGIAALPNIKAKAKVNSYDQAIAFLGNENSKQLASNVKVERRGESVAIVLYNTDILTYHKDGTFEADNGGYNTLTTSNRCTQFGPGCYFHHHKKLLRANGHIMEKGKRFRVITSNDPPKCRLEPIENQTP